MLPTLTRPLLMPTPIRISGQPRSLRCGCKAFSVACISMPANMAWRAWFSSGRGAPQNAMMQSRQAPSHERPRPRHHPRARTGPRPRRKDQAMTAAIDPARWARMSWYARQQWQAAQAREARRVAALRANVEAARAEHVAHYGTDDDTVPELAQTGDERMDQIIDMLNCGYLPAEIADRLGIKAGSVAMWLRRHGRPDLALPFEDQRNHEERHPCPDCGQMCTQNRKH